MSPDTLYHYTSVESLIKIFDPEKNTVSLRFTDINHLNDPLEQKYYFKQLEFNEDECKRILESDTIFVFSLSELKDNLEMWRMYAKDASGVSIGFHKQSLLGPRQNSNPYSSPLHLVPCCYGKGMIESLKEKANMFGSDINLNLSCIFKHECYEHERESRLVFKSDTNKSQTHVLQEFPRQIISEVWIGPKCGLDEGEVRRIIGKDIPITKSNLPYVDPH